jgi:hypothetical protein
MRKFAVAATLLLAFAGETLAWGPEGHSVVAAQRRLSPKASAMVERLLGKGHSLSSIASWADDERTVRPATRNWHFVDMPLAATRYDPQRDCKDDPKKGDCVVAELDRLRSELRCARDKTTRSRR